MFVKKRVVEIQPFFVSSVKHSRTKHKAMKTVEERKAFMTKVQKHSNGIPLSWSELSLAVEDRFTNLRIWIGNEKSISDGCGRLLIYMRLDKLQNYSVPLSQETALYLDKKHPAIEKLLTFYEFGNTDITQLDKVLEIVSKMKHRECREW